MSAPTRELARTRWTWHGAEHAARTSHRHEASTRREAGSVHCRCEKQRPAATPLETGLGLSP
eukprot:6184609-Pleurochrysis_carterae.AAC.3